jgi:hypothetical protein
MIILQGFEAVIQGTYRIGKLETIVVYLVLAIISSYKGEFKTYRTFISFPFSTRQQDYGSTFIAGTSLKAMYMVP